MIIMLVRNKLPIGWPVQVDEEATDSSINHMGCKGVVYDDAQDVYAFPGDLERVFCRFYTVKFDDGVEVIPDYCLESQKVRVTYETPTGTCGTPGEVASSDTARSDCASIWEFRVVRDSLVIVLAMTWWIADTTTCPETLSPNRDDTALRNASTARESGRPSSSVTTLSTSKLVIGLALAKASWENDDNTAHASSVFCESSSSKTSATRLSAKGPLPWAS